MKDKRVTEEKSFVEYTDEGSGVIERGRICGTMPDIMAFSEVVIHRQMDHIYKAANHAIPVDGVELETFAMAVTIDVVKNAFNAFVEEHGAEAFKKAVALVEDLPGMMEEMEAEQ